MSRLLLLLFVTFALSCTDSDLQPTSPDAGSIQADHTPTSGPDLCGGQSPCDASTAGHPGVWFLPPFINNNSPFSGPFVSGIEEIVGLVICEINTGYPPDPPSNIDTGADCTKLDTTEDTAGDAYRASIRFKKPDVGKMYRIHVVIGDVHLAFRDIIIDPNDMSPASDPLLSVGTGNNPIKVRIDDGFGFNCDESQGEINCLITDAGGNITLNNGNVTLNVGPGNGANLFTAQTSACSQLDVDNTLFGCVVSIESGTLGQQQLTATELLICEPITTPGSTVAYVIQDDAAGKAVLTPRPVTCPVSSTNGFPGLLRSGLGKLASLFGAEPLIATSALGPLSGGGAASEGSATSSSASCRWPPS